MAAIPFTPSQLSFKQDTVPINFRVSPGKLLWNDLKLVVSLALYIPLLVLPLRTNNPRSELYLWNIGNLISIASQIMLLISTLTGWSGAIIFILLPVSGAGFTLYALIVLAFLAPAVVCLNRGPEIVASDSHLLSQKDLDLYQHEKWFFINGVIVGNHWLNSAIDELSFLFKRRVYGIRNRTWGFILDLVECLIQRDFDYTTRDVRAAYAHIKDALLEDQMERVVVIAHSQGGIILSMVLDNLLADLPREYFTKLEIYTFACAANHFNNPRLFAPADFEAAIPYIEHYANANDFVSRFGVIEFIHSLPNYPSNRFAGRLFVRPNQGGHFFVQHYLTEMFGDDQWFLDMPVVTKCILPPSRSEDPQKFGAGRMTVRDLSRLAAYLDGGSP